MGTGSRPLRVVAQEGMIADLLRSRLPESVDLRLTASLKDEDVASLLVDADVWISNRFTSGMAAHATQLRLVQTTGIGTDNIDFSALPPTASVCNVAGHDVAVSEYVFMVMLALQRQLTGLDRRIRAGDWSDRNSPPKPELRGRTLGVIGLGTIGSEIARIAKAFQMKVQAITQRPDQSRADRIGLDFLGGLPDLHKVLSEADNIVLAISLSDQTAGMIGPEEFRRMKPGAYLVNVARGPVVDEAALYEALRDRLIAGAAIDVWYQYPSGGENIQPSTYPFHELENVIMTPHIASWTEGTIQVRLGQIVENVQRLAAGEPLSNVVHGASASCR